MNSSTLRTLGIVVALLVAALIFMEMRSADVPAGSGTLLFPGLRDRVNEISTVTVNRSGEDPVVISNRSGRWSVAGRGGYPADVGKVREVLLAMADAKIVEAKTANPELHGRLGVRAPDAEASKGILVSATNEDLKYELIFGNAAQGSYRYARIANEEQSWLIDQNPQIPTTAGEWLNPDIIDIDASRVKSMTIRHPDGETIRVGKESEADSNFSVADIPEGRELSYSTVANGMGGALNDLDLDDVRREVAGDDAVVSEFETFDGLKVSVRTVASDDANWISVSAAMVDEAADADEAAADAAAEATRINERLGGWQYRIADYKANLLTRNWEDILKAEDE